MFMNLRPAISPHLDAENLLSQAIRLFLQAGVTERLQTTMAERPSAELKR
jgi:hypothetical protein